MVSRSVAKVRVRSGAASVRVATAGASISES
jgi:hypothetical protein